MRRRLTYANVMSTIAVFAALGGGAYAAAGSIAGPDGVLHGCYKGKGGALRLVSANRRCSKLEKAIAFNQRGITGSSGAPGAPGLKGERGPQGPGAVSFTATIPAGVSATKETLTKTSTGLTLRGECHKGSAVGVDILTTSLENSLQSSGTASSGGEAFQYDGNLVPDMGLTGAKEADLDQVVRDSNLGGGFSRVTMHGTLGSPCTFWVMITPSS